MFLYVKYGNDQEVMINMNCKIINLLRYVRKISNTDDSELELCDLSGDLKYLQSNRDSYANTLLKEKERYVLLKTERKNSEMKPTYIPLLNNEQIITEDFQNKLNALKKNKNNLQSQKKQGTKPAVNKKKNNSVAVDEDD